MPTPRPVADRLTDPTWRVAAQCRSTSAVHFFAPPHHERPQDRQAREAAARELCGACQVRSQCREHALDVQEPHGIWGGLTALERRRVLRARAAGRSRTG